MAPTPEASHASALPDRPSLLNEKFQVHSYDGSAFKSRAQYDVKNTLIPVIEPFHCSASGTKFNLVLKCAEDFTLTHVYISGPGPKCTEPIKSGLVWVTEQAPDVDKLKKYDAMCTEEFMEIVKGLRTYSSSEEAGSVPDPCLYFTTDAASRDVEVELPKWREGRYVTFKFLDTHKDQGNIDIGIVGLIGYFGRHAKRQRPLGPWIHRKVRQVWVHPNELKSMFSSSGWVCDGRDFTGGCRSGQTDFHQTNVYTVTFRCTQSGFDLCEKCAYDALLGRITDESIQSDLEALADNSLCKFAATRLRNLWRRNWLESLPRCIEAGLLDALVQALQKCIESSQRPEEERATAQRQQPAAENQKRQVRRALLQLTSELAQRALGLGFAGDMASNDLVWAFRAEPEGQERWDEGRVVRLPKALGDTLWTRPAAPPKNALNASLTCSMTSGEPPGAATGEDGLGSGDAEEAFETPAETPAGDFDGGVLAASEQAEGVAGAEGSAEVEAKAGEDAEARLHEACYLVSWRDGQAPSHVPAQLCWRTTSDEDVMMATAILFLELARGQACECAKLTKLLQQGADLMAVNGEGCTALLLAIRAEAPLEAISALLDNGACPDATGREGVTPLELILCMQAAEHGDPDWLSSCAEVLRKHHASLECSKAEREETATKLRHAFGQKMIGALLTLQSPLSLPTEVLEVLHLLFRELPVEVVTDALEPQAFRALTALLQHFVGGTDSLNVALVGCRIMRALYNQPDLKLRYLVRSHGAKRWAERLSKGKDFAQCGIYRQAHHEKVPTEELSKEARALLMDMEVLQEGEQEDCTNEWQSNTKLVELVQALQTASEPMPGRLAPAEGLFALRDLLKNTEKGSMTEDRCTAFELEKAGVPGQLLRYLKQGASTDRASLRLERWDLFVEAFGDTSKQSRKGLSRLLKALHAVVETGEALPVWRHKKERGLKALTEPLPLKLRQLPDDEDCCSVLDLHLPKSMQSGVTVMVEPLVPMSDLSRYLLKVTPCTDPIYLSYCHRLVGCSIFDRESEKTYEVQAFDILGFGLPIPVHTLRPTDGGDVQRMLLSNRGYIVVGALQPSQKVSQLQLKVALNVLQALTKDELYLDTLSQLQKKIAGEDAEPVDAEVPSESLKAAGSKQAFQKVLQVATSLSAEEALAAVAENRKCYTQSGNCTDPDGFGGEPNVGSSWRVHTVMIAVSDDIPFELFWPMVREDVIDAVRELCPRGSAGMEEAVQQGVAQNGMGPIAQKLTLHEAESLATRVGHVVQTTVTVDQQAVQEAQREKAKNDQAESIQLTTRIQFSPKGDSIWVPGIVVGTLGEQFSMVDDLGVLYEKLPRSRVRLPPGRRESLSSAGAPIQAVFSQSDLVRIREHLRRRQQEWAERHNQHGGAGASGIQVRSAAAAAEAFAAEGEQRTPSSSSRPISAPAAVVHRSRASSALYIDDPGRRVANMISREESLSEVDPTGALDDMQFLEDEGMGDDDYDDGEGEGPGDDGNDDEEDMPALDPYEGVDGHGGLGPPRLGGDSRGSDGDQREDGGVGGSMEEEMRVLEQLRAMEQIISEVLDPQGASRARRGGGDGGAGDDMQSTPMTNLRIRMGGGDARVETYQIRREAGPRGPLTEPLRGEFPSFARAADSATSTSTLDHPVVERLGAADLAPVQETAPVIDFTENAEDEGFEPPALRAQFCLYPKDPEHDQPGANTNEPACHAATTAPILLPRSWNLLKAMQFLQDQALLRRRGAETLLEALAVQPLQKVPFDDWCLGYQIVSDAASNPNLADAVTGQEVDAPLSPVSRLRSSTEDSLMVRGKKRRRTLATGELSDAVAREMYAGFPGKVSADGSALTTGELIAQCGDNGTVTDAIELLHIFHAYEGSLNVETGLWMSSKLDRKLRFQLEDPLSVISGTLPLWAVVLPRVCPFLFSLKTRKMLLKYTAFGPSFAVHWTQESKVGSFLKRRATVQTELNAASDPRKMQELSQELSNIEEHVVRSNFWLGTLQSTLVRLQKGDGFLQQSDAAMEILANASKLMEVQFEGETGFGIAVTQSFYVEVAQALQERAKNREVPMWVEDTESDGNPDHLLTRRGLMLKPLPDGPEREQAIHRFRLLGRVMGQGLREGFIVPLPLADEFFALVLGESLTHRNLPRPGSGMAGELVGALADFTEDLRSGEAAEVQAGRSSPEELRAWRAAQAERTDFAERFLMPRDRPDVSHNHEPMSFNEYMSLVGASFLETGLSGAPLCAGGDQIDVTIENICSFVDAAVDFWFNTGVQPQVKAFCAGLNDVFPHQGVLAFTRSELREMFCGDDKIEWDEQALLNHMRPTGGLTEKSAVYKFLVAVLLELDQAERSRFLDFVSSCPRLPPGGITKFHMDIFPDTSATRQGFPRSRACANQLYLPPYTSKEELQEKLHEAMHSSAGHHEQRVRDL
eukprot:TRINITY_DN4449_c0_g2_i1.p1 TRINITY_DN4449_c0_g2~~TRINITY_DN4449_c0_g2_i1.p1  ORF type:complete len:2425 (+),score=436.97 TRINITY_DN4449_c0_g2_i1:100-7374(+)